MELRNAKKDENEKTLEASVVGNEKTLEANDAGKDGEVVVETEAEKDENEAVETSAGDEKSVETSMDAKSEEAALTVPSVLASVEGNETENGTVGESSVLATVEASSSGMKKPKGSLAKKKIVKKIVRRRILKGTAVQVAGEKNVTVEQGIKKGEQSAEPSLGESEKEIKKVVESAADSPQCSSGKEKDAETSLGGDDMESADNDEKVVGDETLKEVKGKASIAKCVGKRLQKGIEGSTASDKSDAGASTGGNVMEAEKDSSVEAPENALAVEKSNSLEMNTSEGGQQKTVAEKTKQNQLTENKRRGKKRQGKQVVDANKKHKKEVVVAAAAAGVTKQRVEEKKEQPVDPTAVGKPKIAGLIFMCNAKTRPDCFRFSVMGVQGNRKDYVMGIKPGTKLFLYDYDLKLLYGIFQASSAGGMKLERNAFGGSFPAQVRFKIVTDCIPLPESQFKKAIKENYNNKNKFKTELTRKQVFKLMKLFRAAPLPAQPTALPAQLTALPAQLTALPAQLTHTLPIPVPRDAERRRFDQNRYAPAHLTTRPHERTRNVAYISPPRRREEPPRDLYLSEREYRTYGLRRGETSQHYSIPPPDSSYRDRAPLDSYRPPVDHHDRLLRQAETERLERIEARLLNISERDYHHQYEHLSSRGRNSPDPVALDSYRRDPYYRYLSPERPPRTYLPSSPPRREDNDLYSRYVTADALAEYYRSSSSSRRYPSMAEPELLPPSSVTSRYAYSGSLPYSHRLRQ